MAADDAPLFSNEDDELPPRPGPPRWLWIAAAGGLLLLMLIVVSTWFAATRNDDATFLAAEEARPIAVSSDGYLGSKSCRGCHQREFSTWHASYHRTMTQVATPETVLGDFDGTVLEYQGRTFRTGRDSERVWVEFPSPDTVPDQPPEIIRRRVMLCTGSHHMQVYWLSTGRASELAIFPFVWLIAEQKWITRESAFLKPATHTTGFEAGRWNRTCIDCHTTHGRAHLDPEQPPESTVSEFGIACEACHGPGEAHVNHHAQGTKLSTHDPIVQPQHLTHARSSEVCGQCHMAWHAEVVDPEFQYRPGDELMRLRRVDKKPSQFWSDGMVRVVGREFNGLSDSPCFQRGTLSCLSCHTMHPSPDDSRPLAAWREDQLKPEMRSNAACLSCHEGFRPEASLVAHTHHAASSEGSRCYNCHMPHTTYGLLKASRSHQISNPSAAETVRAGRPNACNLCHLDKSLGWTERTLSAWSGVPQQPSATAPETSLAVQLALAGDAGQRALMAWHMGWEPSRQVSGDNWLAPYLAILLVDDYPAVRAIAQRSLTALGGYDDLLQADDGSPLDLARASREVTQRWESKQEVRDRPSLFIAPDGALDRSRITRLLQQRDHTEVVLDE